MGPPSRVIFSFVWPPLPLCFLLSMCCALLLFFGCSPQTVLAWCVCVCVKERASVKASLRVLRYAHSTLPSFLSMLARVGEGSIGSPPRCWHILGNRCLPPFVPPLFPTQWFFCSQNWSWHVPVLVQPAVGTRKQKEQESSLLWVDWKQSRSVLSALRDQVLVRISSGPAFFGPAAAEPDLCSLRQHGCPPE